MSNYNDYGGGVAGMKRTAADSGMDDNTPHKKFRQGEGPNVEVRLLIQSKNAGAIIGKAGTNIKRLRSTFNASITVPDSAGPERVMITHAPLGTVCECLRDAIPLFEDYQKYDPSEDFDCDIRLLVHHSQAGCIIGRGGLKIKELRESSGAMIKCFTECCPGSTDRVVQIQGRISRVVQAIGEIFDLLQTAPPKGPINNYDPSMMDGGNPGFEPYGGFEGGRGGGGGGGGRGGFSMRSKPRGGRGGPPDRGFRGGRGGGFRGGRGGFDGPPRGGGGGFRGGNRGGDFGPPPQRNYQQDSSGPQSKTQVSIPKDLAGAIIGKGGQRIKQIRQQSCANIQIDEAQPGSNDRIITISGSQEQIQNAQYLLQLSVKQHQSQEGGY